MGFESIFVKPKRIFLALKYPPWITVENNSTIEKENNGSNGGVKNTEKEKRREERERVVERMAREKRSSEVNERRDEKLRESRRGWGQKRQKIQQIIVVWNCL